MNFIEEFKGEKGLKKVNSQDDNQLENNDDDDEDEKMGLFRKIQSISYIIYHKYSILEDL